MTMKPYHLPHRSHFLRWACLSALALPCLLQAQGNYRTVVLPRESALMPSGEYAVDSYGSAVQKSPADTLRITGQTDKAGQHTVQSELNGKPQSGGTYATGAQRACVQYGTPQMPGNAQPLSDCKTVQTKDSQRTSCNGGNFVMSIRALSKTEWEIESLIKPQFLQGGHTDAKPLAQLMRDMAKNKSPEEQAKIYESLRQMEAAQAKMPTSMGQSAPGATLPDEIHTRERYTLVSNTCSK